MGSFGERLRREREKRNIRLEEIAEATKIGTRSLKALEDDKFSQLPGGIFNKGFVRAYARFLGLNEEELVAEYVAAAGDSTPSPDLIAEQRVMARARKLAAEQASMPRESFPFGKVLIAVIVLAALVYGGIRLYRGGFVTALRRPGLQTQLKSPAATPTPVQVAQPDPGIAATVSPSPAAGAEVQPSATPAPTITPAAVRPGQSFTLSIKSSEPCWLSVQPDGRQEWMGTLEPNEQKNFSAQGKIDLVIGHPSTTELSLNGKPLAIPGDLTHSRRIIIGANGVQTP